MSSSRVSGADRRRASARIRRRVQAASPPLAIQASVAERISPSDASASTASRSYISWPVYTRPSEMIFCARAAPSFRVNRETAPIPGNVLNAISGIARRAFSSARMKSVASAASKAPPRHWPSRGNGDDRQDRSPLTRLSIKSMQRARSGVIDQYYVCVCGGENAKIAAEIENAGLFEAMTRYRMGVRDVKPAANIA